MSSKSWGPQVGVLKARLPYFRLGAIAFDYHLDRAPSLLKRCSCQVGALDSKGTEDAVMNNSQESKFGV